MKTIRKTALPLIWITILVLIADRITKMSAQTYLIFHEPISVGSYFNFRLAYNKGAAFSFLDSAGSWQGWLFGSISVVVSIGILVWLYRLSSQQRWLGVSLTLVLGGALGNLFDRILYGYVIDFLDFHISNWHWPTFNVADSAICIGAFMLFVDAMFLSKK